MQNRLFAELSRMFGKEVPLYDKSLLVNLECNKVVCGLMGRLFPGFAMSEAEIDATSGERHGAIRIGRPDEYRWVARFFACFAMEPHNFYDMTNVGSKSQPIIATAFRSTLHPEHRVFTSLLMTDYFDPATRARIEGLLSSRRVFGDAAKALIEKCEREGGLSWADAHALIREGTERIFKWTGSARDHALYTDLCEAQFKIAADISCFESHHLNHLTPNTFCIDLYTFAMKFCMGEIDGAMFRKRATIALERLIATADHDYLKLSFKHVARAQLESLRRVAVPAGLAAEVAEGLATRLEAADANLKSMKHSGFKDTTEGPSYDTPVLLRQDSYKALTEPVTFTNADGTTLKTVHTARFGEIEQRMYATTPTGRALYDECLTRAEAAKDADPALAKRDFAAYEAMYASHFAAFPKTLRELLEKGLVYAEYTPTAKGLAAAGTLETTDVHELVRQGMVSYEGLRYEDFLPVSAAGIFASNLNQYGTKSTAAVKPTYTQSHLEEIMGKAIIDTDRAYKAVWARSLLATYEALGLLGRVEAGVRAELEAAARHMPRDPRGQGVRAREEAVGV
jgi:uncharacterized glyoxalase superfamily metalloenzyme YdcJ